MVYWARDGSGPYYEAQVDVIPAGSQVLAVVASDEDAGPGYTGDVTCGVRVWMGVVQIGTRSVSSGVMENETIIWTDLYPLSDLEAGIPGVSQTAYFKEYVQSGGVLTEIGVYDSELKSTKFLTITFTYTSGVLTRKTVRDELNSLNFAFDYTYSGGVLSGKKLAQIA